MNNTIRINNITNTISNIKTYIKFLSKANVLTIDELTNIISIIKINKFNLKTMIKDNKRLYIY